jgi:hypothetical protein
MNTRIDLARSLVLLALGVGSLLIAGCGGDGGGDQAAEQTTADATMTTSDDMASAETASAATGQTGGGAATIAGITFDVPAAWTDLGPDGMRQAQYRLAPVGEDGEAAEVNVFYFGPASGGGVEANLQRWIGQMKDATEPERATFTASGLPGHVVSLDGTYSSGGMRPMGGGGESHPGYRLVGVVLEGPDGSVFFKLTGPEATARAMEGALVETVKAARPAA